MKRTLLILLALPLLMAAKPEPQVVLSNPTPSFGERISFQVMNRNGTNDVTYTHGQEEAVFTLHCYQPGEAGPREVLNAWWYASQTFTLGELPLPPYFFDIWEAGPAECELYVYAFEYHQGAFIDYREVTELEFDVG